MKQAHSTYQHNLLHTPKVFYMDCDKEEQVLVQAMGRGGGNDLKKKKKKVKTPALPVWFLWWEEPFMQLLIPRQSQEHQQTLALNCPKVHSNRSANLEELRLHVQILHADHVGLSIL